jgi:hypothetical protein
MTTGSFWVITESDIDAWWDDAEEIEADDAGEAARLYADHNYLDGDNDDEGEVSIIVATRRNGSDAKRYRVDVEIIREYTTMTDDEDAVAVTVPEDPDDGPNEHSDLDDDDDNDDDEERPEKMKGTEDNQTLDLF